MQDIKTKEQRIKALALAALFLAALLLSSVFIAAHLSHECCGEGCGICEAIAVCETVLAGAAAAGAAAGGIKRYFSDCRAAFRKPQGCGEKYTLVSMKVLLLN